MMIDLFIVSFAFLSINCKNGRPILLLIKNSIFLNNALSASTPAHAVGFGAAQTEGSVILKNCTSVDHVVMAQAAVGIYVDGAVPEFATSGVSVAA